MAIEAGRPVQCGHEADRLADDASNQRLQVPVDVPAIPPQRQPDHQQVKDERFNVAVGEVEKDAAESLTTSEDFGHVGEQNMLSNAVGHGNARQRPERSIEPAFERAEIAELSCSLPTAFESITHVVIIAQTRPDGLNFSRLALDGDLVTTQ
ncbi:hypothetical protein MSEO_19230 [Mycobacterium seoulense]|uniref:Uncharacterized protein n=1 Tax=Mycobacterium seoulense TaxID=386911 RepID=A0A7I7NYX1_9MYCO|nr:hypothetical protein MSEO_19230 [Mycobacterium seoulense]